MAFFHLKYPKSPNHGPAGEYDPIYQADRGIGKVMFIPRVVNDSAAFTSLNNLTETIGDVSSIAQAQTAAGRLAESAENIVTGLAGSATKDAFLATLQYVIYQYEGKGKLLDTSYSQAKIGGFTTKSVEKGAGGTQSSTVQEVLSQKIADQKVTKTTTTSVSFDRVTKQKYGTYKYTKTQTYGGTKAPLVIVMPLKPEALQDIQHSFTWQLDKVSPGKQMSLVIDGIKKFSQGNIGGAVKSGVKAAVDKYGREGIMNMLESGALKVGNVGGAVYTPKRQMFQETDILKFTFDWDLIPRSEEEANEIINIINAFRILSYPWSVSGSTASTPQNPSGSRSGSTNARYIIRQPALWQIKFPQNDKFENLIAKGNEFLCIVKSVSMDIGRAVDGIAKIPYFVGSFPNVIKLKINMEEYWSVMDARERFGDIVDKFGTTQREGAPGWVGMDGENSKTTESDSSTVNEQEGGPTQEIVKSPEKTEATTTTQEESSYPQNQQNQASGADQSGSAGSGDAAAGGGSTEAAATSQSEIIANARRMAAVRDNQRLESEARNQNRPVIQTVG
jgi:hypothetical protein